LFLQELKLQVSVIFGVINFSTILQFFSGPTDKPVTSRIYESGPGEFTVEYMPSLTGKHNQLVIIMS